jgi:hypothetical protein
MNCYDCENLISQKHDNYNLELDTRKCTAWNKRITYYYLSLNRFYKIKKNDITSPFSFLP